jgi:hypothetical protein
LDAVASASASAIVAPGFPCSILSRIVVAKRAGSWFPYSIFSRIVVAKKTHLYLYYL